MDHKQSGSGVGLLFTKLKEKFMANSPSDLQTLRDLQAYQAKNQADLRAYQAQNQAQAQNYNQTAVNQLSGSGYQGYGPGQVGTITTVSQTAGNGPYHITGVGVGGGGGVLGGQSPYNQQMISPLAQPQGPAMGALVDLVFAAVECHLRKIIKEELEKCLSKT